MVAPSVAQLNVMSQVVAKDFAAGRMPQHTDTKHEDQIPHAYRYHHTTMLSFRVFHRIHDTISFTLIFCRKGGTESDLCRLPRE